MTVRGNSNLAVPTFIPLVEATRKYNLSEDALTRLIQDGRIDAAQLPSGELVVSDSDLGEAKTKEQIIEEEYGHLRRKPITVSQASKKYSIPGTTIRNWIANGYIETVGNSYPMSLDEATVAYCASVYRSRKKAGIPGFGAPLLDEIGLPYELKHPRLSEHRRRKE
jgi:hypothetical protein